MLFSSQSQCPCCCFFHADVSVCYFLYGVTAVVVVVVVDDVGMSLLLSE